ncbi:MAG: hypothetical protein K9J13_13895 [Saprospiraceae bacterium]|nr:hypothetical protein [Saprospiraceae bacterium]
MNKENLINIMKKMFPAKEIMVEKIISSNYDMDKLETIVDFPAFVQFNKEIASEEKRYFFGSIVGSDGQINLILNSKLIISADINEMNDCKTFLFNEFTFSGLGSFQFKGFQIDIK